jgi:hypothetical protein
MFPEKDESTDRESIQLWAHELAIRKMAFAKAAGTE